MRYDLKFDFKRIENVKAEKGLSRPGAGLRRLFHADLGLHRRPRCDQISDGAARYGGSGWCRSPARGCWCRSR
ncbi:MAG: hypothetical protein MZV49_15800 [Rhodopseudomonas palustris]|nr:hypothetical protein [Rhodopseudomonas palustris]